MRILGIGFVWIGATVLAACTTLPAGGSSQVDGFDDAIVLACESAPPTQIRAFEAQVDAGIASDGRTGTLSVTALLGPSVSTRANGFHVRLLEGNEQVFERTSSIGPDRPAVIAATVPNVRTDNAASYRIELNLGSADGSLSCTRRDPVSFSN